MARIAVIVLFIAGAGLLAASAVAWNRGAREVKSWDDKLAEYAKALETTRQDLKDEGLRFQAFQKSLPNLPDSLRLTGGGMIRDEGRKYDKAIRKLEFTERDIQLDITRAKRKQAEAEAARRARALPFALAGAGSWVAAGVVVAASRARRKAA